MMLFDLGWGKDKGWTSSQACSGVEMWIDFLCGWKSVLGICKQAKWYAHLLAVDFGPSKASEILIHFSRGTEKRPQREPEAFALLWVPPDYLRFPFLVPKTTPPTPSRSALWLPVHPSGLPSCVRPSVRPQPRRPSGAGLILRRWTHRSCTPRASLRQGGVRELGDENGSQLFSGYKEKNKNKPIK